VAIGSKRVAGEQPCALGRRLLAGEQGRRVLRADGDDA
jgi:hypothetical protein